MDYASQQRRPTRNLGGFGAVVLLHIALAWALASGMARQVIEVVKGPIETRIIEEVKPPPPPPDNLPPPPKLDAAPPPSFVPPPEVVVATPTTPAPSITTTQVAPPPTTVSVAAAPPAPPQAVRVEPQVNFNRDCERPEYPARAARAEATGMVVIAAYVDATGRVTQSRIERSSGPTPEHKLLDRAAQDIIARSCKFKPGSVDGKPEPLWTQVHYLWKLD